MTDPDRDPVEELAEEFLARRRRGEEVSIAEYAERLPERAEEIEEVFRTMLLMEQWKERESDGSRDSGSRLPADPPVEVFGDYRILREVGRGGMGIVYEAEQVSLARRVALKLLPQGSLPSPRKVERFRLEAQAAANLHHPNIVQVYGAGEQDGHHYYVMQFVEGRGLDEVLVGDGAPGPHRAAEIARVVARALDYAHGQGTLHRDVKPANLLVDRAGTVRITDFGLAKVLTGGEDLTRTGDVVGTIRYMAPERFEGRSDARSDVYGLGLTLYEMLAGRPAFEGSDPKGLANRVRGEEPVPPRRIEPGIPRDLETITLRAIARSPGDRYPTAAEFAEDLERFLTDRTIRARRAGPAERLVRWCRRNRTTALLAGAAVTGVLLAAAAGWIGWLATTRALERESRRRTEAEEATRRAEENVALSLESFEEIFTAMTPDRRPRGPRDPEEAAATEAKVLESIVGFYDRFAEKNATNPRLRREAARAWRRIAALRERMGDGEAARAAATRARAEFETLLDSDPDDPGLRLDLAEVLLLDAFLARKDGDLPTAAAALGRAIGLFPGSVRGSPGGRPGPGPRHRVAPVLRRLYEELAGVSRALGDEESASDAERRAAELPAFGPGGRGPGPRRGR